MMEKNSENKYSCANLRRVRIAVSQAQICVCSVLKGVRGLCLLVGVFFFFLPLEL